jgi:hypothetical protein
MNHNRAGWILFGLSLVVMTGCTSVNRAASTKMVWTDGTKRFEWSSPKDFTAGKIHFDTTTGVFVVSNLSAQVDQAAVQAARDARVADAAVATEALRLAAEALKKAPITP